MEVRADRALEAAAAPVSGAWATSQRQNAQKMRAQASLSTQNEVLDHAGRAVRFEQVQARNNQGFFQRGENWEDARYKEGAQNVVRVKAFSEGYFQLTRRDPTLNQYFSLGEQVLVVVNGQAIQVAHDGKELFTEAELDALLGKPKEISQAVEDPMEVAAAEQAGDAVETERRVTLASAAATLLPLLAFCVLLVRYRPQRMG
jgi:hypothetical protein